jgi:lipopolysaccharide transport system permease protein
MMTLVFSIILGVLARVPSGGVPYPLLVYVGLLPWTFFSAALSASGLSIVGNSHLITKVYFPRLLVPISAVAARLLDFAIGFAILAGMMVYYHVALTVNVLIMPIPVLLVALLATGLGIFVSAINVKYRDVGFILPVLIQIWMYVSPVLYSSDLIPYKWRRIYALNPLVGIVEGFRSAVFGSVINWFAIGVSAVTSVFFLLFAVFIFRRIEKNFADII